MNATTSGAGAIPRETWWNYYMQRIRHSLTRSKGYLMVYKFKGFDSALCGDSMEALEAIVNAWMEGERPRIRQMCQSIRGEHILLSFVYEDVHELEQRVSAQTQTGITGGFPRIFNDDFAEDRPTSPRIPATPLPMHQ